MAKFNVKTIVEFYGTVEADTAEEAEAKGWQWEDELMYDGVQSIEVEQTDEDDEDED